MEVTSGGLHAHHAAPLTRTTPAQNAPNTQAPDSKTAPYTHYTERTDEEHPPPAPSRSSQPPGEQTSNKGT